MVLAIVLVGQTGSGKTTLASSVAKTLGLASISSGDIAREMAKADPDTSAALAHGNLAPELAMRAEILARIEAAVVSSKDFTIDGFPRRIDQLYILESLPDIQPLYFVLNVDPLTCIRRLIKRGRKNDHPDAVATRFRTYDEFTMPMIAAITAQSIFLDGNQSLESLADEIVGWYDTHKRQVSGT